MVEQVCKSYLRSPPGMAGKEYKGYRAVAVPLAPNSPFSSYLYIRQHVSKGGAASDDLPAGRTLFLANAPIRDGLDTAQYLREAFTPYGDVEDVKVKVPEPKEGPRAASVGFIVFRTPKGLKKAVACSTLPAPPQPHKGVTVMTLLSRFRASIPHGKALEESVNSAMLAFEQAEAAEEQRRAEIANKPDEDGFVTVVYNKKKKLQAPRERRGRKKKKKTLELKNFYRHQIREAKREQLAKLREKFEEDKARIERMKAARKFKPFG